MQNHQQANCKDILNILNFHDMDWIRFSQEKHESGMSELIQETSSLIKKLIGKKYFMHFENTKILRLNVFKYKIHSIFFKGIKIQNIIFYFQKYLKYMYYIWNTAHPCMLGNITMLSNNVSIVLKCIDS